MARSCRRRATGALERIEIGLYGELREIDAKPILPAAVAGVLRGREPGSITLVNALAMAQERRDRRRGVDVGLAGRVLEPHRDAPQDRRATTSRWRARSFGRNHLRLVEMDGVEVDAIPQGHMLYVRNDDTPGVVGHIGVALGERRRQHRAHDRGPQARQRAAR